MQVLDLEWRDVFWRSHRIQLLVLATEEWAYKLIGKRKGNKEITKKGSEGYRGISDCWEMIAKQF